jgi:hypothetical protein
VSSLPVKYLGLPLGASCKVKYIWDDIIKSDRITLIKSTLSNLPTFCFVLFGFFFCVCACVSHFPHPLGLTNRIEKLEWDFSWDGIGEEFKFHLVDWTKVCFPIF